MVEANLPAKFWVRAVDTAVYTRNRCTTKALEGNRTPYEVFHSAKPKISHMRVFGCNCYVLKRKWEERSKFDSKAFKGKFIGYDCRSPAYLVLNYTTGQVVKARNVKFNEADMSFEADLAEGSDRDSEFWFEGWREDRRRSEETEREIDKPDEPNVEDRRRSQETEREVAAENRIGEEEETVTETNDDRDETGEVETETNDDRDETGEVETERDDDTGRTRPQRRVRLPYWSNDYHIYTDDADFEANIADATGDSPETYEAAMSSQDKVEWQAAMKAEMNALEDNGTWELVKRPKGRNVIGGKWVYKVKRGAEGKIEKYKARYVAKGYSQIPGVDYGETYAPTARPETIRLIFALTAQFNCALQQMDVKSAYLHSEIEEEVFLEQPKGFQQVGDNNQHLVCRLKKSIYGLKQAGHNWNKNLNGWLLSQGFKRSECDRCLYYRREGQDFEYIVIWVDDIVICGSNSERVSELKQAFSKGFKMEDKGDLHWFLGMEITRESNTVQVKQSQYTRNLLAKFGMSECKTVETPGVEKESLSKESCPENGSEEQSRMRSVDYRGLVGGLLYLAVYTRPDIAFAVGALSQFLNNPGNDHWIAAKRVLRYLKGTLDIGLTYNKDPRGVVLVGACDADWSGNVDDRRSTSGYTFHIQSDSGAISWKSTKQPIVALSSTEAEYVSLAAAAQETIYIRNILNELGYGQHTTTIIHQDNQGAICLTKHQGNHKRTKHIDVKHHFVRDLFTEHIIEPTYISTEDMEADILTKNVGKVKLQKFRRCILG